MRNAGLGEAQAGIKIARRNINNLNLLSETGVITVTGTDGGVCKWEDRNQFSNDTDCTQVHLL